MTLRTRLFLFFGALIAALASAELWLVRSLSQDLEVEAEGLAMSVGSTFVEAFSGLTPLPGKVLATGDRPGIKAFQWPRTLVVPSDSTPGSPGDLPSELPDWIRDLRDSEPGERSVFVSTQFSLGIEGGTGLDAISSGLGKEMVLSLISAEETHAEGQDPSEPTFSTMVRVPLESKGLQGAMARFRSRLILGSAAILGLGLLVAGFVAHRVSDPLRRLSQAAKSVGEGELGLQVEPEGDKEVRGTLEAFNSMSTRLADLNAEASRLREGQHLSELGDIARGLAHSLRNPLHVLGLSVDRLSQGAEPGLAAAARANIERIDRTLRSLLVLSSAGAEDLVEVDLSDVARDVALELLQDPSNALRTNVETAGPAVVRGVAAEIRAVVHVLMVNAAEASPTGDPDKSKVTVKVTSLDSGVEVCVLDNGAGIDPAVREALFKPHTTSKSQGAGMGLYLAQRIAVNRYHGSLELQARPEGGTLARLVLVERSAQA